MKHGSLPLRLCLMLMLASPASATDLQQPNPPLVDLKPLTSEEVRDFIVGDRVKCPDATTTSPGFELFSRDGSYCDYGHWGISGGRYEIETNGLVCFDTSSGAAPGTVNLTDREDGISLVSQYLWASTYCCTAAAARSAQRIFPDCSVEKLSVVVSSSRARLRQTKEALYA